MVSPNGDYRDGAPSHIHIEKKKGFNWLPWLLLALGILALLLALSRCDRDDAAAVAPVDNTTAAEATPPAEVVATTPNANTATALVGTSGLGGYLAGAEPTPRTFTFEKLNFDTAKSEIRSEDAAEVNEVATTLTQYPTTRIRIAGYADARGADAANAALGKARAESVKAALAAKGVDANRIETVSGGENDPVDTNATDDGRFENRRTELVVTAR
ncbi:OmpA family protein [Sphingomonas xinjiangensis]|uniref:Outer membrane protein OmpA-like peptidoglycan-associated protein n=1 Tax=Sphingomonas xinjiangensis TaxID=643568 RepID=A0A840YTJ2_9SPHN|nr:OmpA family protein [Sphingomonas xinjiangensis]MBB5713036.1 outer membrane protein OmpA-like peptidoglycan-associated protein [Sphingomonas xinjiangensis]